MCTLLPSESYTLYMYARRCNAFTNRRLKKGRENYNRLYSPFRIEYYSAFPGNFHAPVTRNFHFVRRTQKFWIPFSIYRCVISLGKFSRRRYSILTKRSTRDINIYHVASERAKSETFKRILYTYIL